MEIEYIVQELRKTGTPICLEAANAIEELLDEKQNYKESYEAMYRDYQRVVEKMKI